MRRSWLSTEGLAAQGRPYFRHVVQAPALYNGYGSDPFPGLAQGSLISLGLLLIIA